MKTSLAPLGALLFAFWVTGCYHNVFTVDYREYQDSDIEVFTKNGTYYRIVKGWQVDEAGNIRGKGAASAPNALYLGDDNEYPAERVYSLSMGRFVGSINADSITAVIANVRDSATPIAMGIAAVAIIYGSTHFFRD